MKFEFWNFKDKSKKYKHNFLFTNKKFKNLKFENLKKERKKERKFISIYFNSIDLIRVI